MFDHDAELGPEDDRIILAQINRSFWMLEGERHLTALLANNAPYPAPVHCISFASEFDLMRMLPDGQSMADLWSIHPDIITRLERKGELVTVSLPDED